MSLRHTPQVFAFQRPAILGATEMGALLAARFADAGLRVRLYDKPLPDAPNALAEAAIANLLHTRPLPFSGQEAASLIDARNYRDHWNMLADHDLVIECGEDDLLGKQSLLSRITPGLHRDAVLISTTAGLSVQAIAQGLPAGFRPRFLGAHFFRPPRLHRAVECIPTPRTEPRTLERAQAYFRDLFGAEIVVVPDSENFAANRFLVLAVTSAFHHAAALALPLSSLAALTEMICGRANAGLLGILDRVGWQRFVDIHARTPMPDRDHFGAKIALPDWLHAMAVAHGNQSLLASGTFDAAETPLPFAQTHPAPGPQPRLYSAFQQRDWAALCALDHPEAQFVQRWLCDLWTAQAHVSRALALPTGALDTLIRHGLAWPQHPYGLLADFSPRKVLKHLDDHAQTALKSLKWPRPAQGEDHRQQPHPFENDAAVWRDLPGSRSWRYRDQLLIWQPKNTAVDIDAALMDELTQICADAKQEYRLLLIYHRGEHFGARHDWRHEHHHHPQKTAAAAKSLQQLLMALRMLPRPVLLSATGDIRDAGLAILMQADRIIGDMDIRCELTALSQGIPPLGGVCFEWLRRLPALSATVHIEQIHAALSHFINQPGSIGVHRMRELGMVRAHDMFVMNRAVLPQMTYDITSSWLKARLPRSYRVPQPALDTQTLAMLDERAAHTRNPALYRRMLALFAADPATPMLSLSLTLQRESEQWLAALTQPPETTP